MDAYIHSYPSAFASRFSLSVEKRRFVNAERTLNLSEVLIETDFAAIYSVSAAEQTEEIL